MGKKQFALLLLVHLMQQATVNDVQKVLQTGVYNTLQATLNALVAKGLLSARKPRNKVLYSMTDAGTKEIQAFIGTLCNRCLSLEFCRELYG